MKNFLFFVWVVLFGCGEAVVVDVQPVPPVGEGSFTTKIDQESVTVDFTGFIATPKLRHRLNKSGMACVGDVRATISGPGDTCKLEMTFEPDFSGQLVLKSAAFHAKTTVYQDSFAIDSYICPQWVDEGKYAKGFKPVVYEMASSNVTLKVKPLVPPQAGQKVAELKGYRLEPKGIATMKFKTRGFDLDFSGLAIVGDMISEGSSDVTCAQQYLPLPHVALKDINKKSPTHGQEVDVSTAFQGKYVVVHMGAGWCASCVTQVEVLQKIKADLESQGRNDFVFVSVNDASAAKPAFQKTACGKNGEATFPVLQATSAAGWSSFVDCMGKTGAKNDGFVFAPDGRFVRKHVGKGTVYMNVWEDDIRLGLSTKQEALDGCVCQSVQVPASKIHHIACK